MKRAMNRRMFLRGAGGATLALPFLPSLTTRAFASENPLPPVGKCFMGFGTFQGEVWGGNIYPSDTLFTQETEYASRMVRSGDLPTQADENGRLVWSRICQADASVLTPQLASKFNVLRGLDICWNIGHQNGQNYGNFAEGGGGGVLNHPYAAPTIDQFAAYSPSFYTEEDINSRMTQRSMCIGSGRLSWNYVSPLRRKGNMVSQPGLGSNLDLYRYLFEPSSRYSGVDTHILNGIKQSYERLKQHPRLSRGDHLRLEAHIDRMADVERAVNLATQFAQRDDIDPIPTINSDTIKESTSFDMSPTAQANYCDLIADMVALSFSTGACRLGTWPNQLRFVNELISDWHGEVAHASRGVAAAQEYTIAYNQGTFEHIMVKLASKLDQIIAHDGLTMLDHSLLVWTNEHGQITHHSGVQYPVITAGGAGGFFNTGKFVDFSDQRIIVQPNRTPDKPEILPESPGLYYHQFLANVLMGIGVPREEWEIFTEWTADGPAHSTPTGGYGYHRVTGDFEPYYAVAKPFMSDKLPVITS